MSACRPPPPPSPSGVLTTQFPLPPPRTCATSLLNSPIKNSRQIFHEIRTAYFEYFPKNCHLNEMLINLICQLISYSIREKSQTIFYRDDLHVKWQVHKNNKNKNKTRFASSSDVSRNNYNNNNNKSATISH